MRVTKYHSTRILPQVCLEWLLSLVADINCIGEGSWLCSSGNQAASVGEGDGGWILLS